MIAVPRRGPRPRSDTAITAVGRNCSRHA